MDTPSIEEQTRAMYGPDTAQGYEKEAGHGIFDEVEHKAWVDDLAEAVTIPPGCHVLDAGCGTGVLSRLLAQQWRCHVVGVDLSSDMIAIARAEAERQLPAELQDRVRYRVEDIQKPTVFEPGTFDLIATRQVVCHFEDPLATFEVWHRWLRPGGIVMVIDGLWDRQGWSKPLLVDRLPLSCLQTRGTIAYLLGKADFTILHNAWLTRVNAALVRRIVPLLNPRYLVVGAANHVNGAPRDQPYYTKATVKPARSEA